MTVHVGKALSQYLHLTYSDRTVEKSHTQSLECEKNKRSQQCKQKYAPDFMGIQIFPTKQHFDLFLAIEFSHCCILLSVTGSVLHWVWFVPKSTIGLDPDADAAGWPGSDNIVYSINKNLPLVMQVRLKKTQWN